MDNETEEKVVDFLREVVNSGLKGYEVIGIHSKESLEILLKIMKNEKYKDIGQFRVKESDYHRISSCSNKLIAIKELRIIFGNEYSLEEYKIAVETLEEFLPQN